MLLPKNKLEVTWIDPFQLIACYEYSCRIRHFLTVKEREAHHLRLKFYRDAKPMVTETLKQHVANQDMVSKIWKSSREPIKNMVHDVPMMLKNSDMRSSNLKLKVKNSLKAILEAVWCL
uniref:AlNc14C752G12483 protein n=1 Tax=Albugo laibachii Nc14 TaxID=890382 RepID=F0X1Z9_9STRA|nr:AlNc14C752G12483 [Albugo laibachii Nc14]|eukprot:CCA27858.1 AlNc14C752G12483 [Albugo laibachii Nc14]